MMPKEIALIERQFIAEQKRIKLRQRRFWLVFAVGILCGTLRFYIREMIGGSLVGWGSGILRMICVIIYSGIFTVPYRLGDLPEDKLPLNFWQRLVYRMGMEDRLVSGLLLLTWPFLCALVLLCFRIVVLWVKNA